jgi:hypothetical protein
MCEEAYILFKQPNQLDTLAIVQYAYYRGIDIQPKACVERNYPSYVNEIPSLLDVKENVLYEGIDEVVNYYEKISGIPDILTKATAFKKDNPKYAIKP